MAEKLNLRERLAVKIMSRHILNTKYEPYMDAHDHFHDHFSLADRHEKFQMRNSSCSPETRKPA